MPTSSSDDAVERLQEYVPLVASYGADGMSLDRMWPILDLLGNPQDELRVIHIAGTSGKTSTSYYIASLIGTSDLKVGLTVSPHVDSVTERIQINGKSISNKLFNSELNIFLDLIKDATNKPSYFELMIAFVLWVFVRQKVDYAVVETGMGGLMDATNVLRREDKVCVITDIGFDHTEILGDTLDKIAEQKAGIIHKNNNVFTYMQDKLVMNSVNLRTQQQLASASIVSNLDNNIIATLSQLPKFQTRNWNLALRVSSFIAARDSLNIDKKLNPLSIIVPGRMEILHLSKESILIMDGAHNSQKMQTFVDSFKMIYPKQKATILLGLKKGKDYKFVLDILMPIANKLIFTTFEASQDLPVTSQSTKHLKEYTDILNLDAEIIENCKDAYKVLESSNDKIKIITGSFYLLGQIRPFINTKL
jgi:dihydrofolate synthase/folylpolyglutamate synthase